MPLKLLLDHHISSVSIGGPLAAAGHDVFGLDRHQDMNQLEDLDILERAADEGRIIVTLNVKHFRPLVSLWGQDGRTHPGCVFIQGLNHHDFGPILRGLTEMFTERPNQDDWINLAMYLSPSQAR